LVAALQWRNEPPPEIVQKLTRQLKGFLGPDGFSWLCACAVYPEITWPLTLRVAHEPTDYSTLPSLARLPWFRHGFMPDWLSRVLVDVLPPEDESRLRATLERLLEELSHHATDRPHPPKPGLGIARWVSPRGLLAGAAPGSPLRDQVFVGFMFGARPDPLWLRAPQLLARVFRREVGRFVTPRSEVSPPVRSFRERLVARFRWWLVFRPRLLRLALSSALALLAFVVLPPVMTQARVTTEQESISFVEISGGEFVMGSDRKVDTSAESDELPQHLLYVPTFFIATTQVTVKQYSVCVNEGSCRPGDRLALAGPADWPARYLSWSEALAYCRWLENGLKMPVRAS
jgi:Sulfatase-modifying factor enzyme 1